jgi:hypothetical protein
VASGYATAIAAGDAVREAADGTWTKALAGETIGSFCVGVRFTNSDGREIRSKFLPASTTYTGTGQRPKDGSYLEIVEDPFNTIFEANVDLALDNNVSDQTLNFDIKTTAATAAGGSTTELDGATKQTTTAQMRALEFVDRPDNDNTLINSKILCRINEHQFDPAQTATAVGTA